MNERDQKSEMKRIKIDERTDQLDQFDENDKIYRKFRAH